MECHFLYGGGIGIVIGDRGPLLKLNQLNPDMYDKLQRRQTLNFVSEIIGLV